MDFETKGKKVKDIPVEINYRIIELFSGEFNIIFGAMLSTISHIRKVLSLPRDAILSPSGDHRTEEIQIVWPRSVSPSFQLEPFNSNSLMTELPEG